MLGIFLKRGQVTPEVANTEVTAPEVANIRELDAEIARRESWLHDLNALYQELDTAKIAVDHYRRSLQAESTEPALVGNSTFEEVQTFRVELKRQLHSSLQNQNRIELLIEAHGNRYGLRSDLQADLQALRSQKLEIERQADEDAIKRLVKQLLLHLEAAATVYRDIIVLATAYVRRWRKDLPQIIPDWMLFSGNADGSGGSCVLLNAIKWAAGRWDPDLLPPDDAVRQHLNEMPTSNSLHFISYGGGKI